MAKVRIFNCARCHVQVIICSYCDHGQIYCSRECSQIARTTSLSLAGKRYQNSRKGKLKHAERQRRYRQRKRDKIKKVTHHGSQKNLDYVPLSNEPIKKNCCHFCKKLIGSFLKVGL